MAVRSKIPSIFQKMSGQSYLASSQLSRNLHSRTSIANNLNGIRHFPTQDSLLTVQRRMMTTSGTFNLILKKGASVFNGSGGPIYEGFKDIAADYVHHTMTRNLMLVYFRLSLLVVTKDVFLSLLS